MSSGAGAAGVPVVGGCGVCPGVPGAAGASESSSSSSSSAGGCSCGCGAGFALAGAVGLAGLVAEAPLPCAHPTPGKSPKVDKTTRRRLAGKSRGAIVREGGGFGVENKWPLWVAHRSEGLKVTKTGFSSSRPGHPGGRGNSRRLASVGRSFVVGNFTSPARMAQEVGFNASTRRPGCPRSLTDRRCVGNGMRVHEPTEREYTLRSMVGSCSPGWTFGAARRHRRPSPQS